jgi:predicted lipoprotein with Yx(FWY)xxD motif
MRTRRLFVLLAAVLGALACAGTERAAPTSTGPTVTVRSSAYGRVLFDGSGHALYAFTHDPRGQATCYRTCAHRWPPYLVKGSLRAGAETSRALLGATRRRDGSRQLTYGGRPLYFYVGDSRGQIRCQNVREFGGLWLVVRASGTLVR